MKQRLFTILNLSLVSGMVILGFNIITPILPQYALSFSVPVALTGWVISSFALARMFMDIPAGFLADRFGRKRHMVIGLILIVISSIAAGAATEYSWLIVGRVIQGLGSALYITSATTWVAQLSAGESRGRFMSMYSGLILAATSFGPTIGGYSALHFGLHSPFLVYGGFAFLGLLATIPLKESQPQTGERASRVQIKDIPGVILNRPFLLVNSAVLALFFFRAAVRSTLIPLYSSLNLGLTEDKIGLLLTIAAVVTTLGTFPFGGLSDKIGRKKPMMGCLLLSALAVLLVPSRESFAGMAGVMVLYGFATSMQGALAAWPADVAPEGKMGTAMGVYRVIGDMGMVIGPIAITYTIGYSGQGTITMVPFLIPAILAVAAAIVLIKAQDPAASRKSASSSKS